MSILSRRGLGSAGASVCLMLAVTLILGLAPAATRSPGPAAASRRGAVETFVNPPEVASAGGVLDTVLTARLGAIEVAGQTVLTRTYDGLYVPPTLRVRRGDLVRLRLLNQLDQPTNLHYHGLLVPPSGAADNVFVHLLPGQAFDYEFVIPLDHPQGMFWYHPHVHGTSQRQVFGGMGGALVVEGLLDPFPELAGITERVMLLKDIQVTGAGGLPSPINTNTGTTRTVNGRVGATLAIQAGETQLWRIANTSADIVYRLVLDGHLFHEVARDGHRRSQLATSGELLVPPGARVEALVRGGRAGVHQLRTLAFDTGAGRYPEVALATLVVEPDVAGRPRPPLAGLVFPLLTDLRDLPVAVQRTVVFSGVAIDGKLFDENRVDVTARFGDVEEWTVRNPDGFVHVFHIHQLGFQVVEVDGVPQPFTGPQDTVTLPAHGEVKIRVPFTDPVLIGTFVYHCHLMAHGDAGMMAVIQVVP